LANLDDNAFIVIAMDSCLKRMDTEDAKANHAFADGIHVGKYIEILQSYLDSYE
jgi:hypothetical protein